MRTFSSLSLALLFACSSKDGSTVVDEPVDTASSPVLDTSDSPSDSGVDTETDSPADTGDTPTDTSAETAETGETGDDSAAETAEPVSDLERCFGEFFGEASPTVPDYSPYAPTLNSSCYGTNNQDISDVARVVFVGDSITVGTPPTDPSEFYRVKLADDFVDRWGLEAPTWDWEWYDIVNGTTITSISGDFCSTAKWGARTDDLLEDNDQILDCFPIEEWDRPTLVVMTMGGNDVFSLAQDLGEGLSTDELWAEVSAFTEKQRAAVEYLKNPDNWGAPVYVVFANNYEFTDGTGDIADCTGAELSGLEGVMDRDDFKEMLAWTQEEYMSIAMDNGADMFFLMEEFCGHGYSRGEVDAMCDRGDDAELYFDLTCIHPNAAGHAHIAEMVESIIDE